LDPLCDSEPQARVLTSGHRCDDADLRFLRQRLVDATSSSCVDAVDVDVDQPAQVAVLVEQEVGDRELAERISDRRRFELEPFLPARLRCEHRGQQNDRHGYAPAASTERIGGRSRAASTHSPPPCGEVQTEPFWVPKYSWSASNANPSRSTATHARSGSPFEASFHEAPPSVVR